MIDDLCMPKRYRHRLVPDYFADVATGVEWQPDVYRDAADIARRLHCTRLIDIGCGEARKLLRFRNEFELIGVDFGANLQTCRDTHPNDTWLEHDLDGEEPLPLSDVQLERSVVIASDVIEHLMQPTRLLAKLRSALKHASAVVLSTPERALSWGPDQLGPPTNPAHVREWSLPEFEMLLRSNGFTHVAAGLTRANEKSHLLQTIFTACFRSDADLRRAAFAKRAQ